MTKQNNKMKLNTKSTEEEKTHAFLKILIKWNIRPYLTGKDCSREGPVVCSWLSAGTDQACTPLYNNLYNNI